MTVRRGRQLVTWSDLSLDQCEAPLTLATETPPTSP